jgi:hypothetical protein
MSVVHDKSDVEPRAVARVLVYLLIATGVVAAASVPLTRGLVAVGKQGDRPRAPLAEGPGRKPPEPRLQERPFDDVRSLLSEEERVLTTTAWVDREQGIVRIPIDDAIEIVARRGLPVRAAPPVPPAAEVGR